MECYPACDVSLPEIGTTGIRTKLDVCQSPAILTIKVKSDGKYTLANFVANNEMEIRPIRNNYWPLNLRVNFTKTQDGTYHSTASFENLRSGNLTYFMNSTLNADTSLCSSNRNGQNANSDFLWVLLCIILVTCLLFIGISVFTIMSKFNSSKSSNSRKPSNLSIEKIAVPRRANNTSIVINEPNSYLLSPNYFNDERLTVIAEVDEKDQWSEASLSGFDSNNDIRLEHEKRKLSSESTKTPKTITPSQSAQKMSFICQKDQVILPQHITYARRNSQPLIFPTSASFESVKTRQPQPVSFAV